MRIVHHLQLAPALGETWRSQTAAAIKVIPGASQTIYMPSMLSETNLNNYCSRTEQC